MYLNELNCSSPHRFTAIIIDSCVKLNFFTRYVTRFIQPRICHDPLQTGPRFRQGFPQWKLMTVE